MYKIKINTSISAAHRLVDYPGVCARVHGHNWRITVTVSAQDVDDNGMIIDLVQLKNIVDKCLEPYDHHVLNDITPFDTLNPTSENVARVFFEKIAEKLDVSVESVEVSETENYSVIYEQ